MDGIRTVRVSRTKSTLGTITIPKDTAITVCLSILLYVYFIGFFTHNFGIPETAYYVADILSLLCFLLSIKRVRKIFFSRRIKLFSIILLILLTVVTISALLNDFNLLLWIYSLRNWGRFFIYFYLCTALLNKNWINKMMKMTVNVFLINTVFIVIQCFVIKGYPPDALNGLVGRDTSGANIVLSMAAVIIVSSEYISKKCAIKKLMTVFASVLVVSILAELKAVIFFAFLVFGIILLVNSKLTVKEILKVIFFAILSVVAIIFALQALVKLYPEFAKIMSISGLIDSVTNESGYGYIGYIDRFTAIKVINRDLLKDGFMQHLFGIGMGNAEYSTVSRLTSDFYNTYGLMYHYLGFSIAVLYIEGGYVGFGLYVALFIVIILNCVRTINKFKNNVQMERTCYYESIGLGMACLGLIYIWYNNLLRTDMAVLMAFYMAIPFALSRKGEGSIVKL